MMDSEIAGTTPTRASSAKAALRATSSQTGTSTQGCEMTTASETQSAASGTEDGRTAHGVSQICAMLDTAVDDSGALKKARQVTSASVARSPEKATAAAKASSETFPEAAAEAATATAAAATATEREAACYEAPPQSRAVDK